MNCLLNFQNHDYFRNDFVVGFENKIVLLCLSGKKKQKKTKFRVISTMQSCTWSDRLIRLGLLFHRLAGFSRMCREKKRESFCWWTKIHAVRSSSDRASTTHEVIVFL